MTEGWGADTFSERDRESPHDGERSVAGDADGSKAGDAGGTNGYPVAPSASFLHALADAEKLLGRHLQSSLTEGTISDDSPEWRAWERSQDAFARAMAFRELAQRVAAPIAGE